MACAFPSGVALVGPLVLEPLSLWLFGGTPGKLLLGIRVVGGNGGRLSFGQAATRSGGCFVLGFVPYFGSAFALMGPWHYSVHDDIASTAVVCARSTSEASAA
jgi:uncharacterized RDD family membrane protein YckC